MAVAYTPPGVTVEELTSPSINPLLAASAQICLVGLAQGYQVGNVPAVFDSTGAAKVLTAPVGSVFIKVGTTQTFESVHDILNPTAGNGTGVYVEGTDFTTTLSGDSTQITVTPVNATQLKIVGGSLSFSYRFVPAKYYQATRLENQADVEARFGAGFDNTGVVTPLSAAAAIAFSNGAQSIIIQALYKDLSGVRVQPTTGESVNATQWQTTFQGLRDIEDINIVVPVFGSGLSESNQSGIISASHNHVRYMALQGQLLVGIYGEDATTQTQIQTIASGLRTLGSAEQAVVVSPSRFARSNSGGGQNLILGGQYVAAAIAGMIAARPVTAPVTRKQLAGFLTVEDSRDKLAKDADAAAGLMVIEQKGGAVQVRHGLTADNTSTSKRELSVVRAKHHMVESIRDTLETQIIGSVPADGNAALVVKNAVIGVLELLRARRELVDYTGVQSRTLSNDPTTVECRFSYLPAFPLNYVSIVFSLDLSGEHTTTFDIAAV